MLNILLNVIFPVFACVAIGYGWGRGSIAFNTEFVTRLVTNIAAPCLIVSTINETRLQWGDFLMLAQLSLLVMAGFAALGWLVFRVLGLDFKPLSLAVIFPNTGNMGLSLCLFAFGEEGLALGLIIFVVISLVHFATGDLVFSTASSPLKKLLNLFRQPIFCASLVAILLVFSGLHLPTPVALTVKLIGGITIPLMLITLGVSLAALRGSDWQLGALITLLRVPGGLLVAGAVVLLLGVEGLVAKVLILQSAMPSAVFNYFFALKYQQRPETVASGVVMSTLLAFAILPLLLWLLMDV